MMKCRETEHLLYLYRENELGQAETARVEAHVAGCQRCQSMVNTLIKMDAQFAQFRSSEPDHPDSKQLTRRIMAGVMQENDRRFTTGKIPSLHWLQRWLAAPAARYAMTFALVAILCMFAVQEYFILNKISALEARLEQTHHPKPAELSRNGSSSANDLILTPVELEILEKWMVVRKSRIQDLIDEIETLESENQALKRILLDRYPELTRAITSRELSRQELEIIVNNRDVILNTLMKL